MNINKKSGLVLVGFIMASFLAAAIGGYATAESVRTWYPLLNKPVWNPPSWVFGPAWTPPLHLDEHCRMAGLAPSR